MRKILIVEDDLIIRNELKELLTNYNYEVSILTDFKNTVEDILASNSDLILLDINIPNINGEVVLKKLREKINTPIIMVTSKDREIDEVLSMSYGADDYITKPYNPTILLLHIDAVLKRCERKSDFIKYLDLVVYKTKGIIKKDNLEVLLTKNEMLILIYLLNNKGNIVTREELMDDLWNNSEFVNDNTLSVNISRLRDKLEELGYKDIIETRKGLGYIIL